MTQELKISRLLRNSKYRTDILRFQVGEFVYTATDQKTTFPLFEPKGKPFQWKAKEPKPQPKRRQTFTELLASLWLGKDVRTVQRPQPEPESEDLEKDSREDSEGDGLMSEGDAMFPPEDFED